MPNINIPYASNWELVEDNTEYEYRTETFFGPQGLFRTEKYRSVRSKTYEATIQDKSTSEIPAPDYLDTISANPPNPENLSPIGNAVGKWHCDNIAYTKEISVPLSRDIRVTWVTRSDWAVVS